MAPKIDGIRLPFVPLGGVEGMPSSRPIAPESGNSFKDILLEKLEQSEKLKFSAHAQSRLQSRQIELDTEKIQKLVEAVEKAESKGGHESLVLVDNLAFIVNVDNRTVITAMGEDQLSENVFTNIDSAVIVK